MQPAEINMETDNTFKPERHPRSGRGILSESGVAEMLPDISRSTTRRSGIRALSSVRHLLKWWFGTSGNISVSHMHTSHTHGFYLWGHNYA